MILFNSQTVHLFEKRNIGHWLANILTVDDGHGNGLTFKAFHSISPLYNNRKIDFHFELRVLRKNGIKNKYG